MDTRLDQDFSGDLRWIVSKLPSSASKIVDIGCAAGHFTSFLSSRYPNASVIGIDADIININTASRAYTRNNLSFIHCNIVDSISSNIDLAILIHVIEHLPNVGMNIDRINQTMQHGGILFIATDNAFSLKFIFMNMYYSISKKKPSLYLWHGKEGRHWWDHHIYTWTLSSISTLLKLYGFELDDYWFCNLTKGTTWYEKLADLISHFLPAFRHQIVLKLHKVSSPTIIDRSPDMSGEAVKATPMEKKQ